MAVQKVILVVVGVMVACAALSMAVEDVEIKEQADQAPVESSTQDMSWLDNSEEITMDCKVPYAELATVCQEAGSYRDPHSCTDCCKSHDCGFGMMAPSTDTCVCVPPHFQSMAAMQDLSKLALQTRPNKKMD